MNSIALTAIKQLSIRVLWIALGATWFPVTVSAESGTAEVKSPFKNVVDLTHVLGPGLPDFHNGSDAFTYKKVFTVEKDGYANGAFTTIEHYGTHVDAPSHFFAGKSSIDKIPADKLILPCVVIDVRQEVKSNPDYRLTLEKIKSFEQNGVIPQHCAVLLLTGWADRWNDTGSYRNADSKGTMHFPGFDKESADYLVDVRDIDCLGIDTLSIDAGTSDVYAAHKKALGDGRYLIENLKDLDRLPARGSWIVVAPLRIKDGTGSPARIFAFTPAQQPD